MASTTTLKLPEQRSRLIEDALLSVSETERTGRVYAAQEVRKYILAKAAGGKPRRPKPGRR